jgi:hypothetical protein
MKHFLAGAAALVLALSTTAPAMAQQLLKPKSATELDSNLAKHGCRERLLRTEDNLFDEATLLVTCDIDTVKVDKELRTWFFAANHGDTYYDSNSNLVTAAFLEYAAASSLLFHYKTATPDLDSIAVIGRIMGRDNYGHPVDLIAFTYGFDRDLYRKTDPEHIKRCGIHNIVKEPRFEEARVGVTCPQ